jgi:hypothetical protein
MNKDIKRLAALVLIASVVIMLAIASTGSCQTGTRTVGVKAGDWVKYKVKKLGPEDFAWVPRGAVWFMVEVLNVSGTVVSFRETIHYDDGDEDVRIWSCDVQCETARGGYFIGADLEPGDKIGEYPIITDITKNAYIYADLKLNDTEFRTYGGVTREVNPVKISFLTPYYLYDAHLTWERYWDKQTGVLLEKKIYGYFLQYEEFGYNMTNPQSTYIMKIAGTNMWEMETEGSFPWQSLAVAISVGVIIVAAVTIKLRNNRKKNGVREENDENESLCYDWRDSSTHTVNCNDNLGDHVLCHSLEIRHFGHNLIRRMVRLGYNCHRREFKTKKASG